jgi:hypothetical protein
MHAAPWNPGWVSHRVGDPRNAAARTRPQRGRVTTLHQQAHEQGDLTPLVQTVKRWWFEANAWCDRQAQRKFLALAGSQVSRGMRLVSALVMERTTLSNAHTSAMKGSAPPGDGTPTAATDGAAVSTYVSKMKQSICPAAPSISCSLTSCRIADTRQ